MCQMIFVDYTCKCLTDGQWQSCGSIPCSGPQDADFQTAPHACSNCRGKERRKRLAEAEKKLKKKKT
ncbi:uncharacterized protein RAG0_11660 [Rhynchosporium agropyri]|uniref:Uncharacterized protein n=3 Tax=Rhynchosporium TaxID=38037 RepID=A0A1E1MF41_RHYSE|nr:uncharacterized protein RCO7_14508 [Rhynchosporium commune]CZT05672.1 uncharacterized protein RAG0_11660 [Rhynchosporium agropyri]CZT47720.1 uncharacterized protein RSE6_08314 [Rhynchosporium secalis]